MALAQNDTRATRFFIDGWCSNLHSKRIIVATVLAVDHRGINGIIGDGGQKAVSRNAGKGG